MPSRTSGPVARQPLDDAVPGGGVGAADPVQGRDGRVPDEPVVIGKPLAEGRHGPGRADAAQGGRGLEADGGIGVRRAGRARRSRASATRRVPSCRMAWARTEASRSPTASRTAARAATPPSMASRVQIACQRACGRRLRVAEQFHQRRDGLLAPLGEAALRHHPHAPRRVGEAADELVRRRLELAPHRRREVPGGLGGGRDSPPGRSA